MSGESTRMTVAHARELATGAHVDQRDRDGSLHIDHVARVAARVAARPAPQRVAWLHDVLEDCDIAAADLRGRLADAELDAVLLLTRDDARDSYAEYVQRIINAPGPAGELARQVKEADMLDNLHRCARDRDGALARYADALTHLWTSWPPMARARDAASAAPLTIKGVCLDGAGRALLGRNDRGGWELPGGRPDAGESFADCLVRELAEETGLGVTVAELLSVEPFEVLPGRWVTAVMYRCDLRDHAPPTVSDEHEQVAFRDVATLDATELPAAYRRAIEQRGCTT